ncbi:cystatin-C [Xenopus laevis]|uniref:Cystatin domain-containing protein n=2 Tax=Xenopus laevis TaxID=8355 RepID=A0A974CQL6_XENLA|nr:cystatin-C [Xenopus laevis]OCT77800.1 hypothetical protein XELAEV_18028896mg [Xenopus laevis]
MASSWYLVLVVALSFLATLVSTGLVGAPQATDPGSKDVQNAANFALESFNSLSKNAGLYKLIKVISVKKQVVAGMNYFLETRIGATNCQKHTHHNLQACKLAQGGNAETQICSFEVYGSLQNVMSLSKSTCKRA